MRLLISMVTAAAISVGGSVFTVKLLKSKEKPLSKRGIQLLASLTAVICIAAAVVFSLLIDEDVLNSCALIRIVSLFCVTVYCAYIDFRLYIIPNKLLLIALCVTTASYIAEAFLYADTFAYMLLQGLLGCTVCFIIFFLGRLMSRRGMGMGDIKLAALIGLTAGLDSSLGVLLWSVALAAVTGIVMIAAKKAKIKTKLAMAPFFCAGLLVSHVMLIISVFKGGSL